MSSPQRIKFEPALEGLRGFALLGMLLFHSQFEWARGGFLPIATFFTLSGYLITSLFLAEWERSGRLDLVAFWARRNCSTVGADQKDPHAVPEHLFAGGSVTRGSCAMRIFL